MRTGESEVTSESKTLGTVTYDIYETVAEATTALGDEALLDILNSQIKTNSMNKFRTSKTKGPTKSALRSEAQSEIIQEVVAGEHQEVVGNADALEALTLRRMRQIEERMKAAQEAEVGSVGTEDE